MYNDDWSVLRIGDKELYINLILLICQENLIYQAHCRNAYSIIHNTKVIVCIALHQLATMAVIALHQLATMIYFSTPFKSIPNVMVTMDMFDMDQKTNQRADVSAMAIDHNGFDAVFKTWGDTKIARVRVAWMAIGEVKGEDEWDLY